MQTVTVYTGVIRQSVGKRLCLKLLPQFSSYLNETGYACSLCELDVWPMDFSYSPFSKVLFVSSVHASRMNF